VLPGTVDLAGWTKGVGKVVQVVARWVVMLPGGKQHECRLGQQKIPVRS